MNFKHLTFSFLLIVVISFSAEVSAKDKAAKEVVYFSAITLYHPIVMYQKYQPLMDYLTKNRQYRFELRLSQDYRDIIKYFVFKLILLLASFLYIFLKIKWYNVLTSNIFPSRILNK